MTCADSRSSCLAKATGHTQIDRIAPTQGNSFKTGTRNCFLPNLIEREEVKQNEKAEEFVSNERTRQKSLKNDK